MAYVSQEFKKQQAPLIKAVCKKYGVKGSLSVRHHSELVLTVLSGRIDFIGNFNSVSSQHPRYNSTQFQLATDSIDVNCYRYREHFDGDAKAFLDEIIPLLKGDKYFDHSDAMTDYFHCSHYFSVNIGKWDKPYRLEAAE